MAQNSSAQIPNKDESDTDKQQATHATLAGLHQSALQAAYIVTLGSSRSSNPSGETNPSVLGA